MTKKMKLLSFLEGKSHYEFPAVEQQSMLARLGAAKDDIDRSYKQYLCQCIYMPWWIKVLNDLLAMFLTPILIVFYSLKGLRCKQECSVDSIGEFKGMTEIIPQELKEKYDINIDYWFVGSRLSAKDISYIAKLVILHPFSPLFVFKNMMKIAKYSYMIYAHSPKALIVHNEYSFTSSLLTDYCHRHGVKHIDVMHGEKLAIIRDAYFHYDECYVWDEYYAQLFISQEAEPTQFIVALPESMKVNVDKYRNDKVYADYKYYLGVADEDKLLKIAESMSFALQQGKTVKYRLHPRYSNRNSVEKIVGKENIEFPNEVSILESIANCGCVVGSFTTVLNYI